MILIKKIIKLKIKKSCASAQNKKVKKLKTVKMQSMKNQVLNESETDIQSDSEEVNKEFLLREKELNLIIDDYVNYNKYLKKDIKEKDKMLNITMIMLMLSGIGHLVVSVYLICYM